MGLRKGTRQSEGDLDSNLLDVGRRVSVSHSKFVIEVTADTTSPSDYYTVRGALDTASKLLDAGNDVRLIFDGAGTKWVPEVARSEHQLNQLFSRLQDRSPGVCKYCAETFGVLEATRAAGVILLDDYHGRSNLNDLISREYETITF